MSYLKQEFMAYMHDIKGNNNPGSYANGLLNVEKILSVDIDEEYAKDGCSSLYDKLQALRKNPEKIGKNEHTVRQYAMNVNKYMEFREWKNDGGKELTNPINDKICQIVKSYKDHFAEIDKDERYKWEAVAWYKEHWDIDAVNFGEMITNAFSKAENLLQASMYFAYKMLTLYANAYPEKVRSLFRMLYNEEISLEKRYEEFRKGFDEYIAELKQKENKNLQHYQDLHAISVYLFFEYPEKYFIYKAKMYTAMRDKIGFHEEKFNSVVGKFENHMKMCALILDVVSKDLSLISMSMSRLDDTCYKDEEYHLLVMDIAFYGATHVEKIDFEPEAEENGEKNYWPSQEEYDPKITEKEWEEFLIEDSQVYPSTIKMLKIMHELGGEATCKELSHVLGGHPSTWISRGNSLGRRAKRKFNLEPCMDGDKERFFPIPFIGHEVTEDGKRLYAWKLRAELEKAVGSIDIEGFAMDEFTTDVNLNTILYGPPGTGKTYSTASYAVDIIENQELASIENEEHEEVLARFNEYKENGRIVFTTFHQSYGYEEFIEGIRPVVTDKGDNKDIQYDILPGIFKRFCQTASDGEPKENFVFIIDEINRGNISKIFGELITLIEPSKRLGENEEMEVMLPYSGKLFGVPNNVYILGTMNTADRSIATLDTALRRRFYFKEMLPNPEVLKDVYVEDISICEMLERMNKKISALYDREHTIGHSYFVSLKGAATVEALAQIFENNIIPLLQEYFYDDYEKIRLVLGDNKKESATQFIVAKNNDYEELFGSADIGLDDSFHYEINKEAFKEIEAYRSI